MITIATHNNRGNISFKNNETTYNDPLMKWPVRGLAYSNELGAALSEIAPKLGTLLWFPAMLYFGADIYDKYKNEQTSYDPNAKRATQQAIFQLLASVVLPTTAVILGQKSASALGAGSKDGLTLQTQEEIINFLQDFSSKKEVAKFQNNIQEFKNLFHEALSIKREKLIREHKIKNPFIAIKDNLFNKQHPETIALSQKDKVMYFADKHIDEMFEIYNDLTQNKKPANLNTSLWNKFNKLKAKLAKDPLYKDSFIKDASDDIMRKFLKSKINKAKIIKTIGGFVALGLAIKPIDKFVEHFIIAKVVEPKLNNSFTFKPKFTL